MKRCWKITCNPIGKKTMYRVYRQIDMSIPLHGGNVEYVGDYVESMEEAQKIANKMNMTDEVEK